MQEFFRATGRGFWFAARRSGKQAPPGQALPFSASAPHSGQPAEVFHRETGRATALCGDKCSGDTNLFPQEVSPFSQGIDLRPTSKEEGMRQARHIQLEGSVPCAERAIGDDGDLRGGEAGTVYGFGDQSRIERLPRLRENCSLTFH
jgi:hypothetical protein